MTKQDKAHLKVEMGKEGQVLMQFFVVLEENGFCINTQEGHHGYVKIELVKVERDKVHDYIPVGFGEDEKRIGKTR